jgi:hypothetical protein
MLEQCQCNVSGEKKNEFFTLSIVESNVRRKKSETIQERNEDMEESWK